MFRTLQLEWTTSITLWRSHLLHQATIQALLAIRWILHSRPTLLERFMARNIRRISPARRQVRPHIKSTIWEHHRQLATRQLLLGALHNRHIIHKLRELVWQTRTGNGAQQIWKWRFTQLLIPTWLDKRASSVRLTMEHVQSFCQRRIALLQFWARIWSPFYLSQRTISSWFMEKIVRLLASCCPLTIRMQQFWLTAARSFFPCTICARWRQIKLTRVFWSLNYLNYIIQGNIINNTSINNFFKFK